MHQVIYSQRIMRADLVSVLFPSREVFVTKLLRDTFVSEMKKLLLKQYEAGACAVLKTYAIFHALKAIILLSKLLTTIIQCFSWPPATLNIHFIAFTVLP